MNKEAKIIVAVVIIAIIGFGAFVLTKNNSKDEQGTEQSAGTSQHDSQSQGGQQGPTTDDVAATITYDGNSFTSSASTVKAGSKVKVVNSSQDDLDFNSDPHPVHTDNPELNAGDVAPGENTVFTLHTTGTWGFHNHLNSSQKGEITVE